MSGGYLDEKKGLGPYEHVVITFAIKGEVKPLSCKSWNNAIKLLKEVMADRMIAVTVRGEPTPLKYRDKKKRGKNSPRG